MYSSDQSPSLTTAQTLPACFRLVGMIGEPRETREKNLVIRDPSESSPPTLLFLSHSIREPETKPAFQAPEIASLELRSLECI